MAKKKTVKKAAKKKPTAAKQTVEHIAEALETIETPEPEVTAPQPVALAWRLNGPTWEAASLKIPGRTYRCFHKDACGWTAGYDGQKSSCPAAMRFYQIASQAREACRAVEDAIE